MRPLFLLPLTLFSHISAQGNDCCQVKTVGMYKYYYYGIDYMAYDYGCSSPCIYMMEGNYDSKYCFKPGVKNSVCDVPGMGGGYGGGYGGGMGGGSGGGYGGGGMGGGSGGNVTAAPSPGGGGDGSGCRCGVKKASRIVGGTEVSPVNKYPWMAAIMDGSGSSQFCGGTLVASKYVITAAHCMFFDNDATQPLATTDVSVRIGDHNLAATGETSIPEKTVAVSAIYNHENYKPATGSLNNDITVLELAEEVDINVYTPACLAQTSDTTTFDGKIAQVYGWGTTSSGGSSSSTLLEVSLPVVTNTQCATSMGLVEDGQICAGGEAGKDSCQGDSGGPLSYESNGQHILIGDVSYGNGCALAGFYGVYGRISFYRSWIESKMSNPGFCPNGGANAGA